MADPKWGVMNFAKNEKSKTAIIAVADLYRAKIAGVEVGAKQADAAADDAAAAAAYDAEAAVAAYDAAVAYVAAYVAAYDAAVAADAAAAAADAAAAAAAYDAAAAVAYVAAGDRKYIETRRAARLAQADKLLELMAAAPVFGEKLGVE